VAGRAVAVPVPAVLAWQQAIERIQQVVVGAGSHLEDDKPGGRMWDEQRQQTITGADVIKEGGTGRGQIGDAARGPGADGQGACLYGKMLRSASRMRPSPPIAGADS
jgi:hypothetical protein